MEDLATLQWYLKRRRQRKRFDPDQYSLELPGYEPRQVLLEPADRKARVPWRDGAVAPNGLRTVFALESEDIWVPYRIDDSPSPRRIFLRLEPVPRSESIATP